MYQRLHELGHTVTPSEFAVEVVLTPFLFWAHLWAALRGFAAGFFGDGGKLEASMQKRVNKLNEFVQSGKAFIPDITMPSLADVPHPSRTFIQVWGYLESTRHRQRKKKPMSGPKSTSAGPLSLRRSYE